MEKELNFIAGEFFDNNLDKEQLYLYKYFRNDVQRQFVRYFSIFNNTTRFSDHTGRRVTRRWLRNLKEKFYELESVKAKAKKDFDLETLAIVESGNYKC